MDTSLPSPLAKALDDRWAKYRANLEACRQAFSEEAVHDARVSTRRLLALVDLLQALPHSPPLKPLRRALKAHLDGYDDLRDTQVILLKVTEALDDVPELAFYRTYLQWRETQLLQSVAQHLETLGQEELSQGIETARQFLQMPPEAETLLQSVDEAYAVALRRYNKVDASRPATIHRLRVAFKKLRYTLEILKPFLPDFPARLFKEMHDYQTAMGDIQDMEVLLAALADFAKRHASYDAGPARRYFQRVHARTLYTYLDGMEQLHTFWRPTPESPFPWTASPHRKKTAQRERTQQNTAPVPDETDQEKGETP